MKNKTILVTGAAGFVGYYLSEKITSEGHKVITASKMYHLCNNFYQARQRNVPVSAKQCTTNTSCIM
ncbi:NAD-dependent epimerase/dehydratase family protein [Jeotgalibaca sp. A127]|uniref:NAD-dependent epimerase/dehydratase family protein n=1 Tax=Jeotgalibaca sp. A127 TaxID=3457324 RepID=UPI003FD3C8C3